ncbi:hypothetical protein StoSoilB20_19540 [Arthrobacter sp. StoSoilB20]|nr:hypothetical protein StoSoilB20_19540 [Arthrobacter sp. StoSoilB20]
MPKRITYLEKRDGMPREAFRAHWSTAHAEIARALPGVVAYRQNHVHQSFALASEGNSYAVDGIVELWFEDEGVVRAGYDSDVAERLAADETNFLSGLTGGAVSASEPHGPSPHKLWLLARWQNEESADQDAVTAWADRMADEWFGAIDASVNFLAPGCQLLTRNALRAEPLIPQVAMAFAFADETSAATAASQVYKSIKSLTGVVNGVHGYLAHELVII